MDTRPAFGPADDRPWEQDITLSWTQERWPTRRGWSLALMVTALIPALATLNGFPVGFVLFGPAVALGLWRILRGQGPLVSPAGQATLQLTPDRLIYDVIMDDRVVSHFELARADAANLELRLMDKANTAISVCSRDGRCLELGERRLDPRIEGRHLLLSTWLGSWWPDATGWHERLGPRGLALLDATGSQNSAKARHLRDLVRRTVRLSVVSVMVALAWALLLEPTEFGVGGGPYFHLPLGSGEIDSQTVVGLVAIFSAVVLLLYPTIQNWRAARIPGAHPVLPGLSTRMLPRRPRAGGSTTTTTTDHGSKDDFEGEGDGA